MDKISLHGAVTGGDPNPITSILGPVLVMSYLKYLSQRINELTIFTKGLNSSPRGIPKWLSPMSVKDDECSTKLYRSINAFEIISLYPGIDLSCLFEKDMSKRHHARFTTKRPPSTVVSKLEEIAQIDGRFKVMKQNGIVRLEEIETRIDEQLSIDIEIFEVTSSFYIVELGKIVGYILEYRKFWNQYLKPSLN